MYFRSTNKINDYYRKILIPIPLLISQSETKIIGTGRFVHL